jgi:hypothetical protein
MKRLDATVKKETLFISAITFILCVLIQSVFLISGAWDLKVLYGTLLGFAASVLNFLLMGYTVQTAVLKEEKDAKSLMKLSQTLRFIMLIVIVSLAYLIPIFNIIAVAVPLLFPRIAIIIRQFTIKK